MRTHVFNSLEYILKSGIASSHHNSIFNHLRNCQPDFSSGYTICLSFKLVVWFIIMKFWKFFTYTGHKSFIRSMLCKYFLLFIFLTVSFQKQNFLFLNFELSLLYGHCPKSLASHIPLVFWLFQAGRWTLLRLGGKQKFSIISLLKIEDRFLWSRPPHM